MKALMFNVGRPFRLHLPYQVLGGWELTDGQALVIDDGGYGITAASTAADLIRGYGGGQLEWLEQHHPTQHDQ